MWNMHLVQCFSFDFASSIIKEEEQICVHRLLNFECNHCKKQLSIAIGGQVDPSTQYQEVFHKC